MTQARLALPLLLMALWGPGGGAFAQAPAPAAAPPAPLVVADIRFRGEAPFSEPALGVRVRTRANRRFLDIPGLTWWRWIYALGASGRLGDRLGQALMAGGEAPAYLDSTVLAADVERLRLFYVQEGFREADVQALVDTLGGGKARVTFAIAPGAPTFIRRLSFDTGGALTDEQQRRLVAESAVAPAPRPPPDADGFFARGQRYSATVLLEERRRILTLLRNEGYAYASRDSVRAIISTPYPDSFDVAFRIRPGARWRIGALSAAVAGPEHGAAPRRDTLYVAPESAAAPGEIPIAYTAETRLEKVLLRRALRIAPGQWYDASKLIETKRRLDATGVFAFTDIAPLPPDTLAGEPALPHRLALQTRRRHGIRLETFMLQRTGVLGGSDTELGAGVGTAYQNGNLFGAGETLELRTLGSIAGDLVSDTTLSAQAEASGSLSLPYLVAPFSALDRALGLYEARTRLTLSLLTARRDELRLIIRGRGVARFRLEMMHSPTLTSFVDVLDVSLSNPDTLSGFKASFLDVVLGDSLTPRLDDPVQRAQIEEDYTQPQVNTAFRYTLRAARGNPFRRDQGYSYEASAEVGGNLPYLLDRYAYSPGAVEGSLPGLPIFRGGRFENRLIYRQYARFVADLRRYQPLGRRAVLALRFTGGMAHPTGKARVVPFDRRFYSGGPTSVRGWSLRELGPGAASFTRLSGGGAVANLLGGDIKLEAAAEYRRTLVRNLFAGDWQGAAFLDAGNVWTGPRNLGGPEGRFRLGSFATEVGVGSGLGVRVAWEYLIVRFDLGYKVYDPARPEAGFLPDGLRAPKAYFGIGHTF